MHKARHTACQRVLDATGGNPKAVQKVLRHSSIHTMADIYTDWDIDQLTKTFADIELESGEVTTKRALGIVSARSACQAAG
jgi:integrase